MATDDVNSLFSRAEQAFVAGENDRARSDLASVQALVGDHPDVLHLIALVERRRGQPDAARDAFARALALAPDNATIRENYGNFLDAEGDFEAALAAYDKAATPSASHKRVQILHRLGRNEEALIGIDALAAAHPADAGVHTTRGLVLRALARLDEAANALDQAITIDGERANSLHARARLAMERGEARAALFYKTALTKKPGDFEIILGMCQAMEAEGDAFALTLLGDVTAANPGWAEGHRVLARMRAEAGDEQDYARGFAQAVAQRPQDRALHDAWWETLAQGERFSEALTRIVEARRLWPNDPDLALAEAVMASEAGDDARADAGFAALGDRPDALRARGRHALRGGAPEEAAALLERRIEDDPEDIAAWAHLGLAWRVLGDPRHTWLAEQEGLVARRSLDVAPDWLDQLATLLRDIHKTRAHPIGQSLRGGTQTRGQLFARTEPLLRELARRIEKAVSAHVAALPPVDPGHPLLRHRERPLHVAGSWSVRLTDAGFHVNHIHPQGLLSSAFYVHLPPMVRADDPAREGWLEIGAPPVELGLALPSLVSVRPEPGVLALFPSYLHHGTRPFAAGERLTVAFDVAAR